MCMKLEVHICTSISICVCVCEREREREKERVVTTISKINNVIHSSSVLHDKWVALLI
jgi:hypothetical protein